MSAPFKIHAQSPFHSIPLLFTGSFAVDNAMRITWGPIWGSFEVWGSFGLLYRHLRSRNERIANQSSRKNSNLVSSTSASFYHGKHTPPHRTFEWLGARCSTKLALKSRFWNRSWTEHLHEADSTEEKQTFIDGEWNLTFILKGDLNTNLVRCSAESLVVVFQSDGMFLCKMNIKVCLEDLLSCCCSGIVWCLILSGHYACWSRSFYEGLLWSAAECLQCNPGNATRFAKVNSPC